MSARSISRRASTSVLLVACAVGLCGTVGRCFPAHAAETTSTRTVGVPVPSDALAGSAVEWNGSGATHGVPLNPSNCCPPESGAIAYGGSPFFAADVAGDMRERPYAPGLYWIGPFSHARPPCPQLHQYLPGYYRPVYGGSLPLLYATAEYLALFRDSDQTIPFAARGLPGDDGPNIILSTAEFNGDYQSGIRTIIGAQLNEHIRLEGLYFGSYTWGDFASVNNRDENGADPPFDGNLFSPFSNFGAPGEINPLLDYNTTAQIEYDSRLNNAEINLRHRLFLPPAPFEASVLVGARYMKIDESFGYLTTQIDDDFASVDVETSNDLIGIQLGILGQFLITPWAWLDWESKGVVAHNTARQQSAYGGTLADLAAEDVVSREEDTTSFIGETSLVFNYQFRPNWTFRLGYQAIWVTGLALAEQNFESHLATVIDGPARLHHAGDTVYHGFNIGLSYAR